MTELNVAVRILYSTSDKQPIRQAGKQPLFGHGRKFICKYIEIGHITNHDASEDKSLG